MGVCHFNLLRPLVGTKTLLLLELSVGTKILVRACVEEANMKTIIALLVFSVQLYFIQARQVPSADVSEDTDGEIEKRMLKHTINYTPGISKACRASSCAGKKCGCKTGHNKGYCWTRCSVFGILVRNKEWCYTNGVFDHSQNMEFVKCSKDSDCCSDWSCGSGCTV